MLRRIHQAERLRGCCFAPTLNSAADIAREGGVVTGSPSYDSDKGIRLNGSTDCITYPASVTGQPFASGVWSCCIEFTPNFEANEGFLRYFYRSSDTLRVFKYTDGGLYLRMGGGTIIVPYANHVAYWRTNQRNVLVVCAANGVPKVYLNGNLLTMAGTAVAAESITSLNIGSTVGGTDKFSGHIHSIKFFKHASAAELLTAGEALDAYNRSTYTYQSRATCILPMGAAQHDAVGNRTLDVSPNGNHFTFGDGATPTTYPTKISGSRGYSFDGGDSLRLNKTLPSGEYSMVFAVRKSANTTEYLYDCRTDAGAGFAYWEHTGGNFSVVGGGTKYINNIVTIKYRIGTVDVIAISGTAMSAPTQLRIGLAYNLASTGLTGSIFYFALYPFAMTPTQVAAEYGYALQNSRMV